MSRPDAQALRLEVVPAEDEWPQLEAWAREILERSGGAWVIPETFSMRAALDQVWVKDARVEKGWHDGHNMFRLLPAPPSDAQREGE